MFEGYDFRLILLSLFITSVTLVYCCRFITRIYLSSTADQSTLVPLYSMTVGSVLFCMDNLNWIAMNPIAGTALSIPMMLGSLCAAIFVAFNAFSSANEKYLPFSTLINRGFITGLSCYAMFYLSFASRHPAHSITIDVTNLFFALISACIICAGILLYFFKMKSNTRNRSNTSIVFLSLVSGTFIITLYAIFNSTLSLSNNTIGNINKLAENRELITTIFSLSIICLLFLTSSAHDYLESLKKQLAKLNLLNNDELQSINAKDALTHLPNRLSFETHLNTAIKRSSRAGKTIALAYIDLDHFKPINDNYGHHVGDAVIVAAAQRINASVRACDFVARLGGDEFVAIIEDIAEDEDITPIIGRIVQSIKETFNIDQHRIDISCSIGVAVYPGDGDIEKLIVCADAAMYKAKENGKNQFKFYDTDIELSSDKMLETQHDLRLALKNNEFSLVYQTKIDCKTLSPIGAEALIRWNHPTKGVISPRAFIPAAERFGLINQINEWVIEESCRAISRANQAGIHLDLSINLANQQFRHANLVDNIIALTDKYKVLRSNLIFEIKETATLKNEFLLNDLLAQFKAANMRVALDDFGSHPFTLSYLQNLKVDEIKLDKLFVASITDDKTSWKLVDILISLAHTLNLNVVAEGVETEAQKTALVALGCNHMQGYLFSKPLIEKKLFELFKDINIDKTQQFSEKHYQNMAA